MLPEMENYISKILLSLIIHQKKSICSMTDLAGNIKPNMTVLSIEQKSQIHNYSIKILEKTGIRVDSEQALDLFKNSDGAKIDGNRVFIQPELVEHAINSAPSTITIYKKTGEKAFCIGNESDDITRFGIGVTNSNYQEIGTNKVIPFRRDHTKYCTRLGDMLDSYDMVSTVGIPSDVPPVKIDLYNMVDMYANTDKPLVVLLLNDGIMDTVIELLNELHGDIAGSGFIIPYVNPVTPLILNESTTQKMITSIENDLPVIFSNYGMSGGTTPITSGGTLALLNAELLAGLVFSQLVKEGSKVILGSLPAAFNMNSMVSSYTPESYLINIAVAEMMDHYSIPHCGTSGSGIGWGPDINASGDLWMNHFTSVMSRTGMVPFVGGNFDSKAFSPGLAIMADNIIKRVREFTRGFSISEKNVNLDEIIELGPGADFFTATSTLESLHKFVPENEIWPVISLEEWISRGNPDPDKLFLEYSEKIFSKAIKESEKSTEIIRKGEEIIRAIK